MRFYLSSYRVGNELETLRTWSPKAGKKTAYISNALDFTGHNPEWRKRECARDIADLTAAGLSVEELDLREYFGKKSELRKKIDELGAVWVRGGNTFVLRMAFRLSGLDEILFEIIDREDFLYAGYSAAGCLLSKDMAAYAIVDKPNDFPYPEIQETIWEGLGILDFAFLPHYDSDHHESADIDKEIKNCIENKILFKALRDGEVLMFERTSLKK